MYSLSLRNLYATREEVICRQISSIWGVKQTLSVDILNTVETFKHFFLSHRVSVAYSLSFYIPLKISKPFLVGSCDV